MNLGVSRLEKVRIYELAKELNTTSKRLMEKLAEINIIVKNHMSFLEKDEIKALYDHIGVIQHNEDKKAENEARKAVATPQTTTVSKKDSKNAPRIIRKTEIIIDTKSDSKDVAGYPKRDAFAEKGKKNRNREFVKVADANSGLRAGFVRDTGLNFRKDLIKPQAKTVDKKAAEEPVKADKKPEQELEKAKAEVLQAKEVKHKAESEKTSEKIQEIKQGAVTETKVPVQEKEQALSQQSEKEISKKTDLHADGVKAHEDKIEALNAQDGKENIENAKRSEESGKKVAAEVKKPEDKKEEKSQNVEPEKTGTAKEISSEDVKADKQRVDLPGDIQHQSGKGTDADRVASRKEKNISNAHAEATMKEKRDFRSDRKASPGSHAAARQLDIDIAELATPKKEEAVSQRGAGKRELQSKEDRDLDIEIKREQRKEIIKGQVGGKAKKLKPHVFALHEKKDISEILSDDFDFVEDFYTDDNVKRTKKQPKQKKESKETAKSVETKDPKHVPQKAVLTSIKIPESITVKELAEALKKSSAEVIKKLMSLGLMAGINQEIDFDTASIVADEFGVKAEKEIVVKEEDILFDESEDKEEDLVPRPPVVVVMGHVDHGKTSLLDAIRKSNVTENEAGGITQHIGAYTVKINNRNITFLDTPGHEAFTVMRARGAQVTDIAILVVAADDGVMPQTVEAINHAKAANVTIIVAINKIDKPGANPERVKQQLTEYGLIPEEWGGDTICVPVSAKNKENIDTLLEMVLLTADIMELKANPNKQAKGTVIEAKLDKNRGPVATLLVQRGILKTGDSIITGATFGRIRAMTDDKGKNIKKAGPSTPVEIIGLPEVPEAGETFYVVEDEKLAKQLVEKRKQKQREQHLKTTAKVSLDDLFNQIKEGHVKELNIIVKADVQGSVEALKQSLEKLSNDEVKVKIIHGAVGAITESDVILAQVSNAIIIGFNVRPGPNVADAAKNAGVDMRLYRVIYNAIEDIEAAMKGMLEPTFKEVILGHTEVRQIFKISGVGTIGGCYVLDGKITRNSEVRVVRDGIVIHEGRLASLKRFKDDVKEVVQGYECGLSIEKFNDIKEGDIVESFILEEIAR
ncbi:MAG TPA: translation initiation factor IF-2 [Clostridiaceae bacterium]|nr:translation initiation factor IF-2 [Clostridiaceae bacterium]